MRARTPVVASTTSEYAQRQNALHALLEASIPRNCEECSDDLWYPRPP
ncbi:MAG: hypothetical protein R3B09_35480 [Nannocystaceae bacterium]